VANPLDKSQYYLRKSLIQQMKSVLQYEVDAGNDAKIFQIGRVFDPNIKEVVELQQPWRLGLGLSFKPSSGYVVGTKILGLVDAIYAAIGVKGRGNIRLVQDLEKGRQIELGEIDLTDLSNRCVLSGIKYQPVSNKPKVLRDVSAFLPTGLGFEKIMRHLEARVGSNQILQISATTADWYKKDNQTSITLHFIYQAPDRTLKKEEVDQVEKQIKNALAQIGATIR
jgi:phenylalanyl-tRNA synthetase beta subunit